MKKKELLEVIELQYNNLQDLLQITTEKREALINRNTDNLNSVIKLEEEKVICIKHAENRRLQITKALEMENGIFEINYKIEFILSNLKNIFSKEEIAILKKAEKLIKEIVAEISKLNKNNMSLIKHSQKFINETMNLLVGSKGRTLLDRRV